jgi:hypothetical protein
VLSNCLTWVCKRDTGCNTPVRHTHEEHSEPRHVAREHFILERTEFHIDSSFAGWLYVVEDGDSLHGSASGHHGPVGCSAHYCLICKDSQLHKPIRRGGIMTKDHFVYYENTSLGLALLRNGSVWRNDDGNAPEVKLAIQLFTLHVY